jgi:hypothetical protein
MVLFSLMIVLSLIPFRLGCMTWFRPQLHDRAVDEVIETVMGEERLRLGDLDLICTAFPCALVISCDGVF